ncbi:MAG: S41 family peptidase [Lachnospira sp.]|nr:S41 family peptidase [Lachnospira sp.]
MEENFNEESKSELKPEVKVVNEGAMARGVLLGVLSTILVMVAVLCVTVVVLLKNGYLHISTDGSVYVQSDATTDDSGIGSEVEAKLNAIESVLDSKFYFENVDSEEAAEAIYKAYLSSYGDKYTVYYTAEEYQSLLESTTGTFYGIGATCQKNEDGTIQIVAIIEDSPAEAAGLQAGDKITAVDGQSVLDLDLSTAVSLIKGDKGTDVVLSIIRDSENLEITATRDEINVKTVEYQMMEDNIGYIAISQFDEVTTDQFIDAIEDLEAQGMVGLVIDIRDNPGGVLSTVVDMLEYILPDGLIVYTEDVDGNRTNYSGDDNNELTIPVAVLVNGNSASASEIFAGAVQDYELGAIIGTQTFGKGIVQTIQPLTDGSAIKYTIAKYFTPKGQDIHGVGVTPDITVEPDSSSDTDNQLEEGINYVKEQLANQ